MLKSRLETDNNLNKIDGRVWTREMCINLRYYAYESYRLSWITDQEAMHNNKLNKKIVFWAALLASLSVVLLAGIMSLFEHENYRWLFYVITSTNIVVAFSVAVLNNYNLIYNLAFKVTEFQEKSNKYGKLYRRIKNQFYLPVSQRYNCKTLMEYTTDRYDELDREMLFIRETTQKEWDAIVPKDGSGRIDYDKILQLPSEFRSDMAVDDHTHTHSIESYLDNCPRVKSGGKKKKNKKKSNNHSDNHSDNPSDIKIDFEEV